MVAGEGVTLRRGANKRKMTVGSWPYWRKVGNRRSDTRKRCTTHILLEFISRETLTSMSFGVLDGRGEKIISSSDVEQPRILRSRIAAPRMR